jgi:hypothetical protein
VALISRDLIRAARDGHPSFTAAAHPDPVLVRALSAEQRRLLGKMVQANPSAAASTLAIDLTTYDFAAGVVLPAHHHVHDPAEAVGKGGERGHVFLISHANLNGQRPQYGYAVHAGRVFLAGTAREWSRVMAVNVSYTPVAGELDSLTAPLVLPDTAEPYMVRFLEVTMAKRLPRPGGEPIDVGLFVGERNRAEADLLTETASAYRAVYMRPVKRY